jgi:hypothetical protein
LVRAVERILPASWPSAQYAPIFVDSVAALLATELRPAARPCAVPGSWRICWAEEQARLMLVEISAAAPAIVPVEGAPPGMVGVPEDTQPPRIRTRATKDFFIEFS